MARLADAGADVVICARRVERLEETREFVEAHDRRCVVARTDVGEPEDWFAVVQTARWELGQIDVLVSQR